MVNEEISGKIVKSEEDWQQELDPESYRVLREKGTEKAFTGKYNDFKEFYARFTNSQQACCLKICIDTCHVFASGFDPLKYLKDFYELYPDSLVLVHYNDSKTKIGSEFPGPKGDSN